MQIENRSAEHGGEIIADGVLHDFKPGKIPVMAVAIVDTVILAITSPVGNSDAPEMENIAYYNGKTVVAGEFIYANIASLHLTSGVMEVIL